MGWRDGMDIEIKGYRLDKIRAYYREKNSQNSVFDIIDV